MIAAALWFNSGILLFADADLTRSGTPYDSKKIFQRRYGAASGGARSVFVVSDVSEWPAGVFQRCERALEAVPPEACTIDRMRDAIEEVLFESCQGQVQIDGSPTELTSFVALYSPIERRYALFHTLNDTLREVVGHDCVGAAAHIGHYLIRDRYDAARSMDALDLATVFSIATDTLEAVRACNATCGASSEMAVMYADGHVSDIQRIPKDTHKQRHVALAGLART